MGYDYHSSTKAGEKLTKFARDITGLPVIANGGLHDPALAHNILSNEEADFIAIGKTALTNPDLPQKIATGEKCKDFTFDVFSRGMSIAGQLAWESDQSHQ